MELGVNTFGMGGLLKAPFRRTIGRLKENGITGMEPCIHFLSKSSGRDLLIELGMKRTDRLGGVWTPDEAKEKLGLLREDGFRVDGAHLFIGTLTDKTADQALSFARENGLRYYALSCMTDRFDLAAKQIPVLRRTVKAFRAQDLHLLLHNHDMDLKETEGLSVLDFLLDNVPGLELELDVGWMAYAGRDCSAEIEKYRQHLRVLHFKDMLPDKALKKHRFCAVGEGMLPLAAIMEKVPGLELFPAGMVIDQDASDGDMMADILTGAANIRKNAMPEQEREERL